MSLLRASLSRDMGMGAHHDSSHLYYSFRPVSGVKVIGLDCFESSLLGLADPAHPVSVSAAEKLFQSHGTMDQQVWDTSGRLQGLEQRFQLQNGLMSDKQLLWLHRELEESDGLEEQVIVFGHVCLLPSTCDPSCLLWNYDHVLRTFAQHTCVVAYLCGHAHVPGYALDEETGVHFLVMSGVIESQSPSFSTLTLFHDRLEVRGHGSEMSMVLPISRPAPLSPSRASSAAATPVTPAAGLSVLVEH